MGVIGGEEEVDLGAEARLQACRAKEQDPAEPDYEKGDKAAYIGVPHLFCGGGANINSVPGESRAAEEWHDD